MKALVVNPPAYNKQDYIREGRCMQAKSSWAALWTPLTLAYIAAGLRQSGHRIRLVDCIALKLNVNDLLNISRDFKPDLIVMNTAFPSLKGDMATATALKKGDGVKIAAVGLCVTLLDRQFLEKFRDINFAIIGEPEWAVRNLVTVLEKNEPLNTVQGLIFWEGKKVIENKPQDFSANNPNALPFPARDLLDNSAYTLPVTGEKFTLLSVGRGCPYSCTYCIANVYYGKKFRKRAVTSIVDEIEECVNKYGISNFLFWGESFTMDPDYGAAICDEILKKGLNIKWSTTSRVDTLNKRLLSKMKKAGCLMLGLGIESVEQGILDGAKKGITLEDTKNAIRIVKEAGIQAMGHFIFGLPGDTKKTARETIDFALDSGIEYAQFYCAVPYPKTELGELAKAGNWIESEDYSDYDLNKSVMHNETLTVKEIMKLRDSAYRKFYMRPKMIIRTIKNAGSLSSFFSVLNFFKWIKPKRVKNCHGKNP